MISWMQKNNKFLIITIWIATISFIFTGATAGFSFGIRSNSIGKVGEIELKRDRFSMEYNNLFNRYNQMMQGKFDKDQAKRMGLEQQVLNNMATQAKILNLAKDFGIIVTEEETGKKLSEIPSFQKNGVFDRKIYDTFISNSPFQQDTFEASFKDQLIIEKTLKMLNVKGLKNEYKAFQLAFEIADKLKYSILTDKDVNVSIDETKLKSFWETRKEQYKTAKQYTLDIQWTDTKDTKVTEKEINDFYAKNKFNYTNKEGKILPLEEVKDFVIDDLKVKLAHKPAYKRYLSFQKGESEKTETLTLNLNDPKLSKELWNEINTHKVNDFIKPKAIKNQYASVKIVSINEPVTKTFQEVKESITPLYQKEANKEALSNLAEKKLSTIDNDETNVSKFITLDNAETQNIGLNKQETVSFISKLFTSEQEKGIIPIGSKVIVYKIVEQKLITLENNRTKELYKNTDQVKEQSFQTSLIKKLDKMYPTEFYK
ncbi:Peptidyl-prolyl cis-trans isomerase PpiD [hydrothermal vent metagenome]|uniref:Peptidyl-prolyl cis-trans isomerase PpiD n=1 Tax=hydrothermal vent metagenome TaxID=652676 RepID=A0A1W1D0E2_9ZZZZ